MAYVTFKLSVKSAAGNHVSFNNSAHKATGCKLLRLLAVDINHAYLSRAKITGLAVRTHYLDNCDLFEGASARADYLMVKRQINASTK